MSVKIRKMTTEEFDSFYAWSVEHHTKELMVELHKSRDEAIKETTKEVAQMLPDGLKTQDNYLMTIVEETNGENIGFIWTLHEVTDGKKQSFICDFYISELERKKGFGAKALHLAEEKAVQANCLESVLYVRDDNAPAIALYKKCGYQVLRQAGCGKYMVKQLR